MPRPRLRSPPKARSGRVASSTRSFRGRRSRRESPPRHRTAHAQQNPPYGTLTPPQPTEGGGKIEVIEFFWYGCPHCYHLEPQVNAWLKTIPQDVVFRRVHALPSPAWAPHAQIFYTLQAMGL